ncbi:tetratricopeptide repeat protein [Flagellimonas sp. 2504JD4-2]
MNLNFDYKKTDHIYKLLWILVSVLSAIKGIYNWVIDKSINLKLVGITILLLLIGLLYFYKNKKVESSVSKDARVPKFPFKIRRRFYYLIWGLMIGLICLSGFYLYEIYRPTTDLKIMVFKIEGPKSDEYRVSDIILNELKRNLQNTYNVTLISVDDTLSETDGSDKAKELGEDNNASIVIWGYYALTKTKLSVKINFEDLQTKIFKFHNKSDITSTLLDSKSLLNEVNNRFFSFDINLVENLVSQKTISKYVASTISTLMGVVHYNLGNYNEAKSYFLKGTSDYQLMPNKKILDYQYLGLTNANIGNLEKAIEYYDALIKAFPDNTIYRNARCFFYLEQKEYDKALDDLNKLIDLGSITPESFNKRAVANIGLNKFNAAIVDARNAISLDSTYFRAYNNLSISKLHQQDLDSALYFIDLAIKFQPQKPSYMVNKARVLVEMKKYKEAEKYCLKARKIDQENVSTYITLVDIYNRQKKFGKAKKELGLLKKLGSNDPDIFNQQARVDLNNGNAEKALNNFNKAISINPKEPIFYLGRGAAFHYLKEYKNAVEDYSVFIKVRPNNFKGYLHRGTTYAIMEDFDRSTSDFDRFFDLVPNFENELMDLTKDLRDFSKIMVNISNFLSNKGQIEKAMRYINYAIKIDETNSEAYYTRGKIKAENGNFEAGLRDINSSIKISPNNIFYYFNRIKILLYLKDFDGALRDYDTIVQLDNKNIEAYVGRANLNKELGNYKDACHDWQVLSRLGYNSAQNYILQFCN